MLTAIFGGLIAGAILGFVLTTKIRDDADAAKAKPIVRYRHTATGRTYELVCHAAMHDTGKRQVVLIDTTQERDGRYSFSREIWPAEIVDAEFEPA